jgi:hypothetical protein
MPQNWLRTDEKENAVDSLEMAAQLLMELKAANSSRL